MFRKFVKASALELFFRCITGIQNSLTCFYKNLCNLPVPYINYQICSKQIENSRRLFVPFQIRWRPHLLHSYFGLIFELLIKQIFLLRHSFLRCLFTSVAFVLSLSLRGIIPESNTLLISDLHKKATSMMSLLISLALFSFFRLFVPQRRTLFSGLLYFVGNR